MFAAQKHTRLTGENQLVAASRRQQVFSGYAEACAHLVHDLLRSQRRGGAGVQMAQDVFEILVGDAFPNQFMVGPEFQQAPFEA